MKKELLSVKIDDLTWVEFEKEIVRLVKKSDFGNYLVRPNAEIVVYAQKDPKLRSIINKADLSIPDGIGLLCASKILNTGLKGRFGGPESMIDIVKLADENCFSIYLLGAKSQTVEKAAQNLQKKFKKIKIVGFQNGYCTDNTQIISAINKTKPNIVFVGMGSPKQEKWIWENRAKLKVNMLVAEGGSFDYLAGEVSRAPVFIRKIGFDWLFRLINQPKRLRRQLSLIKFLTLVVKEKLVLKFGKT